METTDDHKPTPEELALCIEESAVRAADACEQSPAVLRVDGSVIGTLGNFSASIGKAKSKKTFNVAALTAAALTNGTVLHYRASFPEEKRGILYIDTEQGRPHCQQVLRRILRLAGLPEERDHDNLVMLTLRKFPPDLRLAIVDHAIGTIPHLGLVIIDGIRDLLYDINSPKEATDIISRFMQWTDDRQIHIHTILHQNKNDENARGHIGTELNNKAETILQISKSVENGRISEVRAMHIRDREFTPFAFEIGEDSLPRLVKDHQFKMSKRDRLSSYMDMTEQQHRTALEVAFPDNYVPGYQMLLDALKRGYDSIGYSRGRNTLVGLCKFLIQNEAIVKDGRGYAYNENFRIKNRSV